MDESRRQFLKTGAAVGGLVWVAPTIMSMQSASAASAAPCTCKNTGTAYGLSASGTILTLLGGPIGPLPATPGSTPPTGTCVIFPGVTGVLTSGEPCGLFTSCDAVGSLSNLAVLTTVVTATVISGSVTSSSANCCTLTGSSIVTGLEIAGVPVTVTGAPNQTVTVSVPGVATGSIIINQQTTTCSGGNATLTVNALNISVTNLAGLTLNVIVGHASMTTATGNCCTA